MRTGAVTILAAIALAGCAELRTFTASPGDLADYRAFRVAAYEGTRLARAKKYLEQHPDGAFAAEVRRAFDDEEPQFFARAQESREGARRYLVDLPDGPHAAAAFALLTALESDMQDAELRDVARRMRFEDAKLEAAAVQRRAVSETIVGAVGVLLDEDVYGVPRNEGPRTLKSLMTGRTPKTWGDVPARREDDLFFLLPTQPERESRLLTLVVELEESDGVVTGARISGADMFVRWAEADLIRKLDPASARDRREAQAHVLGPLEGALERRFPSGSCEDRKGGAEILHRACGGWEAVVTAGAEPGAEDSILIRVSPPRARKPAPR